MKSRSSEVRRARPLLGTFVDVVVEDLTEKESHRAIDRAFDVIADVQGRMSFHDPGSMLSFINRNAGHVSVPVDDWTFAVLEFAAELYRVSDGVFDVTIARDLQRLGFLPNEKQLKVRHGKGSFAYVELGPGRHVHFHEREIQIDLGGIAKGFAVDQAVTALQGCGVQSGLVNAGGDLRAFGEKEFPVTIRHPRDPKAALFSFGLTNATVATSGHYFADRICKGATAGPIVDRHTGMLAGKVTSATVRARRAMVADALTKVVMISGEHAFPVLKHCAADAIFVSSAGEALCTSAWHATLDLSS